MRKILFPFFLFVCICTSAQVKYMPGTITMPDGKVITGLIENKDWLRTPSKISFKTSQEAEKQSFGPSDILGFEITGVDVYRAIFLEMDMNPIRVTDLGADKKAPVKGDYFLRVLVQGERITLLEYTDFKPHFLVQWRNGPVEELQYAAAMDIVSGTAVYSYHFRTQLKMADSTLTDEQVRKIDLVEYRSKDLQKLVTDLNGGVPSYAVSSPTTVNNKKVQHIVPFIGAGPVFYSVKYTGAIREFNSMKFEAKTGFLIAAGIDLPTSRNFQRFIIRADVAYSKMSFSGKGESYGVTEEENSYELDLSTITAAISAIYKFANFGSSSIYAGGGFGYNFSSAKGNTLTTIYPNTGTDNVRENYPKLDENWAAVYLKLGAFINNRIDAGLVYRLNGDYIDDSGVDSKTKEIGLRVLWRFVK